MRVRTIAALLVAAAAAGADRVVERDGRIRKGNVSIAPDTGDAVVGSKRIPADQVYLAERDDGTLVYAPDFDARLRGYEYLAAEYLRDACVRVARTALHVCDHYLARKYLERAERAGFSSSETISLKDRVEKLAAKQGGRRAVASARVEKEAASLDGYHAELLAQRAACALDGGTDGARLLREALRLDPKCATALELLRRIAPAEFPVGDARVWLDWHLDLESSGAQVAPRDDPELEAPRVLWRPDLHAVRAAPILLVTPVKESRLVGRCLAHGRPACSVLAQLFRSDAPARVPDRPMTILLFENKDEYMTRTGTGGSVEYPAALEWTAGHYSPADGVSRFYWHADLDAERRIVGTRVHELTHHWLEEQNPRTASTARLPSTPAFWIVEGFAAFMEEGVYDVDTGAWDLFNPRAASLDALDAFRSGKAPLIPWDVLYTLDQARFHTLPVENARSVVLRWELIPRGIPTKRLFYEQAAATCHYLDHAEGGRFRGKLLDYVVDWYDGRRERLGIRTASGVPAAELGKRVEAFARSVAEGWIPAR